MPVYHAVPHPAQHPPGVHTHIHDGVIHAHDTRADSWIFWTFALCVVAVQVLVFHWKRKSPKTFGLVTTGALWAFPMANALYMLSVKFIGAWLLFSLATGYFVRLATRKPLPPTTPRAGTPAPSPSQYTTPLIVYLISSPVYRYFDVVYRASSAIAVCSYGALMFAIVAVPNANAVLPTALLDWLLVGMLYSVYFGVRSCRSR